MRNRVGSGIAMAWAMARGDRGWRDRFETSPDAVSKSFLALPLALPAVLLTTEIGRRAQVETPGGLDAPFMTDPLLVAVGGVLTTLFCWGGSLYVLTSLAERAGPRDRLRALMIGYNWSRLIADLVAGLGAAAAVASGQVILAAMAGAVSGGLRIFLDLGVIRHALGLALGQAIGAYLVVLLTRLMANISIALPLMLLSGGIPT